MFWPEVTIGHFSGNFRKKWNFGLESLGSKETKMSWTSVLPKFLARNSDSYFCDVPKRLDSETAREIDKNDQIHWDL